MPGVKVDFYLIGSDAGKAEIMRHLGVTHPGPDYWHFPLNEDRGYDFKYFNGLLSEKLTLVETKYGKKKWMWRPIPGHPRNEPLDCRNYAMAAFAVLNPNFDAIEDELKGRKKSIVAQPVVRTAQRLANVYDSW